MYLHQQGFPPGLPPIQYPQQMQYQPYAQFPPPKPPGSHTGLIIGIVVVAVFLFAGISTTLVILAQDDDDDGGQKGGSSVAAATPEEAVELYYTAVVKEDDEAVQSLMCAEDLQVQGREGSENYLTETKVSVQYRVLSSQERAFPGYEEGHIVTVDVEGTATYQGQTIDIDRRDDVPIVRENQNYVVCYSANLRKDSNDKSDGIPA